MKLNIYNQNGEISGEIKVVENIFNVKFNQDLVHQAVVAQMANERGVFAHTKDRSEVRGGGKKPWKQKGTGRARAGSSRSPIWIGGGVTFGPTKDRNFSKNINKKMKRKAMFMALSDKVLNNSLVVLEKLELNEFKTKIFNNVLKNLETKVLVDSKKEENKEKKNNKKLKRSMLFIDSGKDEKLKYSGRNLAGVKMINLENINLVDLLKYKKIIITDEATEKLEEKYKK